MRDIQVSKQPKGFYAAVRINKGGVVLPTPYESVESAERAARSMFRALV